MLNMDQCSRRSRITMLSDDVTSCRQRISVAHASFVSAAQPYVAIDWEPDMKKRFYNENEAEVSADI